MARRDDLLDGDNDAAATDGSCKSQEAISTIMSRSPRLESRESGSSLPPTAYHPSLMLASTELGVYIKWALLLQEHLEHVQGERAGLVQQCSRLQADNHMLRRMLVAEDPTKYAQLSTSEVAGSEDAEHPSSTDEMHQQAAQSDNSSEPTPPIPSRSAALSAQSAPGPPASSDMLSTSNLRVLASFLKETQAPVDADTSPPSQPSLSPGRKRSLAAFDQLAADNLSARSARRLATSAGSRHRASTDE